MLSDIKSTFLKPQSTTGTLRLTPIPQISHFALFKRKPEKREKREKFEQFLEKNQYL